MTEEDIINQIYNAFHKELKKIMYLNKDERELKVNIDTDTLYSSDSAKRKPLFSIDHDEKAVNAIIYNRVFHNSVFTMISLTPEHWSRLVREIAWHEYAHLLTLPSEIDLKNCSYLSLIFTDFLANYFVINSFNQSQECLVKQYSETLKFLKSKFNSMKRMLKKGYDPTKSYCNLLFNVLEISSIFFVNNAWKNLIPMFEEKDLVNYLNFLHNINSFYLKVVKLDSTDIKKYKIVNNYSQFFSEERCYEILMKLFIYHEEVNYPSSEMVSSILHS